MLTTMPWRKYPIRFILQTRKLMHREYDNIPTIVLTATVTVPLCESEPMPWVMVPLLLQETRGWGWHRGENLDKVKIEKD